MTQAQKYIAFYSNIYESSLKKQNYSRKCRTVKLASCVEPLNRSLQQDFAHFPKPAELGNNFFVCAFLKKTVAASCSKQFFSCNPFFQPLRPLNCVGTSYMQGKRCVKSALQKLTFALSDTTQATSSGLKKF